MTFSVNLLILFATALLCSVMGFYKYVYFISIGYGLAISGQGLVMLFLFRHNLTPWISISCMIFILYGLRLSGFLLLRELKSGSYQKHMKILK